MTKPIVLIAEELSPVKARMLLALKTAFDPDYRLNPGCQIAAPPKL